MCKSNITGILQCLRCFLRAVTGGAPTVQQLRSAGIKADMDHCGRSLKAQFKFANKTGAPVTAVIGDDEAAQGLVKLKKMADGTEKTVKVEEAADAIREMKG